MRRKSNIGNTKPNSALLDPLQRLSTDDGAEEPPQLGSTPPLLPSSSPLLPNNASAVSDHRFMAVVTLGGKGGQEGRGEGGRSFGMGGGIQQLGSAPMGDAEATILVVAAASDASVQLSCLQITSGSSLSASQPPEVLTTSGGVFHQETPLWPCIGSLQHPGQHPVISLAKIWIGPELLLLQQNGEDGSCVGLRSLLASDHDPPLSSGIWLVLGGATDGCITAWLVPEALANAGIRDKLKLDSAGAAALEPACCFPSALSLPSVHQVMPNHCIRWRLVCIWRSSCLKTSSVWASAPFAAHH